MDTSRRVMPPKAQLAQQEIDEIVAGINQVNALRVLSKKFKIGQGRIRRIWGQAGVTYRENYYTREKLGVQLTPERMGEMMTLARIFFLFVFSSSGWAARRLWTGHILTSPAGTSIT